MTFISPLPCGPESGAAGSVVALDAPTLAALETITVNQGTSPWVVSGTVFINDNGVSITIDSPQLPAVLDADGGLKVHIQNPSAGGGGSGMTDAEFTAHLPLPVSDNGGSITVDAIDFDIRNLLFATDKVDVSGSVVALDAPTLAALEIVTVLQGTSPWIVSGTVAVTEPVTVDAVDFDIRNLAFATDKVDVSGSTVTINEPVTVDAVDLDIRNLTFAQDKVDVSGSTVDPIDDYDTFEAQHVVLAASTDTTITFSSPARLVRISNWDTVNRILVKDGDITSDGDSTAARVGRAPAADVPGQMYFPFATTTVHIRSAAGSEVTVEGYKGSV